MDRIGRQLDAMLGPVLRLQKDKYCDPGIKSLGDGTQSHALGAVTVAGKRLQTHQVVRGNGT